MEDPDEDEVMIGEVQVNDEVEHQTSEVSVTEFDDWQQKEYEGLLRELQSQNDFVSFHGVPSSEVTNKEVIKTRWVLKQRFVMKHFNTWKDENNDFHAGTPTPVSFNLVLALAAKRVALGKSQTIACLDVSTAFLHVKMKDEVYIKLDADTLRMIHEENMTNPTEWTKPCIDTEAHHDIGRTPWKRQQKILDSSRARSTTHCTWIPEISSRSARA